MPRHDHDAGGDAELLEAKASLREEVWSRLEEEGAARFPVVTTVHPLQVLEEGRISTTDHDVFLDWIVTPDEVIRVEGAAEKDRPGPKGIVWDELTEEKIASIPLLERLRGES